MSRSIRGGKPVGYEYWGRRKGGSYVDRRMSHKMERMKLKEENKVLLDEALFELNEGCYDLTNCVFYRSLFPKAKTIEYYHHLFFLDMMFLWSMVFFMVKRTGLKSY